MYPAVFDLKGAILVKVTLGWQIVGIALMIAHGLLCKQSLAFYPVMTGLFAWLYYITPLGGVMVFFQVLLFQNLILSIVSVDMDYTAYTALQGTNFVMLVEMALISGSRLLPHWHDYRAITVSLLIAFAFILIYLAYGIVSVPATSALVYLREFAAPLLAVVIGIDIGRKWSFRVIGLGFLYSAVPSLALSLVEYCYPIDFYNLINAVSYYQLKVSNAPGAANVFNTPEDVILNETATLFNLSGGETAGTGWTNFRFAGTVMHPISNAYVIAVAGLLAVSLKHSPWLFVVLPMLLLIGVKGAVLLMIACLVLWMVWRIMRNAKILAAAGLIMAIAYVSSGIYLGMQNQDFHVIGFLGGFNSLISTPWGHGLGAGGNMSAQAASGFRWTGNGGFQTAGAEFALESAVGVLFYQMGVASIVVFAVFMVLLIKAPLGFSARYVLPKRTDIMFFALGAIAVNGIFQEEAFAPYAAGMLMMFCGVLIGNGRRQSVSEASVVQTRRRIG